MKTKDFFVVSVYLVDRAFGGYEEGGWYYTYGIPQREATPLLRTFRAEDEAYAYMQRLQRALDVTWNHGRHDIGSVLSEGEYRAIVDENEMPHHFPQEIPHYE